MSKWIKYAAIAGGAYVAWKLLSGAKLSELLSLQGKTGGAEGKASTNSVAGKPLSLANSTVSKATGVALGGDGSPVTPPYLDSAPFNEPFGYTGYADSGGIVAPGNPMLRQGWEM